MSPWDSNGAETTQLVLKRPYPFAIYFFSEKLLRNEIKGRGVLLTVLLSCTNESFYEIFSKADGKFDPNFDS